MKTTRCAAALALLLAFPAHPQTSCPEGLEMGWEAWAPFQMKDDTGTVTGFDVELTREVSRRLGCELRLREVPWERHKAELRAGTIDLAAGIAYLEEREEWLHYSDEWRTDVVALYVLAEDLPQHDFEALTEIAGTGFRLGVRRGYHYGGHFDELVELPGIERQLQAVDQDEQNIEKLLRGRIDGFIADVSSETPLLRERELSGRIVVHPAPVYNGASFAVFSRASVDAGLVEAFDRALEALRADGTYARLHARFLE